MQTEVLTKRELKRQIKRFLKDRNRGISKARFAELCGLSESHLMEVFYYEEAPLTQYVQQRASKGWIAWQRGEVAVMRRRDNTRFVEFRKEPEIKLRRTMGLQLVNGEVKISLGVKNRADYSAPTLKEQLDGE